jgi:protein LTV1
MRELAKNMQQNKWDCETIVSTYTNTDNHPGLISDPKIKNKKKDLMKIAASIKVGAAFECLGAESKEIFTGEKTAVKEESDNEDIVKEEEEEGDDEI